MRFPFLNNSKCPIGLDLGAHSVRMIQLDRLAEGFSVRAAASRALPAELPAAQADRVALYAGLIKQMLETGGFVGRRVVSCLPPSCIQYKNLRVPRMPSDELRAAVEYEAADRLRLPADSIQVQFFDAGQVHQGEEIREEVIALAATRQQVNEHLEVLSRSDLKPVAIDAVPGALARCIQTVAPPAPDTSELIVDVGFASAKVLVVRGGRVVFFKQIDIGGRKLDQLVAQHLNLPITDAADLRRRLQTCGPETKPAEGEQLFGTTRRENLERAVYEAMRATAGELAREIALCLRYFSVTFRGSRPEVLRLAGGEAYEPQLARVLSEDAGLQVEALRPLEGMDLSKAGELSRAGGALSEWAVAVGLSMRPDARQAKRGAA